MNLKMNKRGVVGHATNLIYAIVGIVILLVVAVALYPILFNATQSAQDNGGSVGTLFSIFTFLYWIVVFLVALGLLLAMVKGGKKGY